MDTNTYYLELMFILLNIFMPCKLMKKDIKIENLFLRRKHKNNLKKNLVVNLLESIQVSSMMTIMKLVKHKYLSVNLKTNS